MSSNHRDDFSDDSSDHRYQPEPTTVIDAIRRQIMRLIQNLNAGINERAMMARAGTHDHDQFDALSARIESAMSTVPTEIRNVQEHTLRYQLAALYRNTSPLMLSLRVFMPPSPKFNAMKSSVLSLRPCTARLLAGIPELDGYNGQIIGEIMDRMLRTR